MTLLHRSMFASLSLLLACSSSSSSQSQNPDAGVYDDYYSEKSGGEDGSEGGETADTGDTPAPRVTTSTKRAERRKGIPKALASKKPPVKGKKKRKPTKPANLPDVKLAGFLPTIAAAGSVVEVHGEGLDRKGLQVLVGVAPQKVTERSPDRLLFNVRGGEGPIGIAKPQARKGKTQPAFLARSQTEFHFIPEDSPFGKPRTRPGNGLIGNVYQVSGEVSEVPDFDSLGTPMGVIAVDNLDFSGQATGGLAGMDGWYAIHFKGSLNVVAEGDYSLCLNAGDGALLFLDENLVVDNDGRHEAREVCESIFIEPGEYQLDLLWFQDDNPEMALQFLWAKDGGAKEPVPAEALFPPESIESLLKP